MAQRLQLRLRAFCHFAATTTTKLATMLLVVLSIVTVTTTVTSTSFVSAFSSTILPQKTRTYDATRRRWQHHGTPTTARHDRLFAETTIVDDAQQASHVLRISKPLGIIIEEIDTAKPERGVYIGKISPDGNCCKTDGATPPDICVNDEIIGVNGLNCTGLVFEEIMDAIVTSPGGDVELELRRPQGATVVRWPNGVGVAVLAKKSGEYLGNVAIEAGYDDRITYDCRSGSCGVCSLIVRQDGERRVVKPCVAKIRRGRKTIFVESGTAYYQP